MPEKIGAKDYLDGVILDIEAIRLRLKSVAAKAKRAKAKLPRRTK